MSITIYKTEVSTPSRAVLMTAELLKLSYQTREVNCVTKKDMRSEIRDNTIPVLQDEDLFIADSHVIITYLVSKYGADMKEELYPSNIALRAIVDQRLYFEATKIFPKCKDVMIAILHEKASGPTEKQIAEINETYNSLESYLQKTKFIACDHLTVADVSIISTVVVLEALVPLDEKYRKLYTWLNQLKEMPWYQKANVSGLNQQIEQLKNAMEKNSA